MSDIFFFLSREPLCSTATHLLFWMPANVNGLPLSAIHDNANLSNVGMMKLIMSLLGWAQVLMLVTVVFVFTFWKTNESIHTPTKCDIMRNINKHESVKMSYETAKWSHHTLTRECATLMHSMIVCSELVNLLKHNFLFCLDKCVCVCAVVSLFPRCISSVEEVRWTMMMFQLKYCSSGSFLLVLQ